MHQPTEEEEDGRSTLHKRRGAGGCGGSRPGERRHNEGDGGKSGQAKSAMNAPLLLQPRRRRRRRRPWRRTRQTRSGLQQQMHGGRADRSVVVAAASFTDFLLEAAAAVVAAILLCLGAPPAELLSSSRGGNCNHSSPLPLAFFGRSLVPLDRCIQSDRKEFFLLLLFCGGDRPPLIQMNSRSAKAAHSCLIIKRDGERSAVVKWESLGLFPHYSIELLSPRPCP